MDPLEKQHLRQDMAKRMTIFLRQEDAVSCVSGHWNEQLQRCELCLLDHGNEMLVIKNRAGRKMLIASQCLKEMIRFKVIGEVENLQRWLETIRKIKAESGQRKAEAQKAREEERRRLERKVIVRRRVQ